MKKILLLSALVLTIATSMIAGTLATYTKTLNPIEGEVTAKRFDITANSPTVDEHVDVRLAPGETADWNFVVRNYEDKSLPTEVGMDVQVSFEIPTAFITYGVTPTLTFGDNKYTQDSFVKEDTESGTNRYIFTKKGAFTANESSEIEAALSFNWDMNLSDKSAEEVTRLVEDQTQEFSVTITGTQSSN